VFEGVLLLFAMEKEYIIDKMNLIFGNNTLRLNRTKIFAVWGKGKFLKIANSTITKMKSMYLLVLDNTTLNSFALH
jgi:hypothetical protein